MNVTHRRALFGLVFGIGLIAAPASRAEDAPAIEDKLIGEKCSLCHSSKRALTMDPATLKPVLERMRKMNPDWLTTANSDHIVGVLAKLLEDPQIVAGRQAWREAIGRGEALFKDAGLGKNGKACSDCHTAETMKQVADGFPRYDLKLRRLVTLDDIVAMMVREQLGGNLDTNSPQLLDLMVYLTTLK